ncbi:hypothetical protein [Actinoplanes philippinensis]|nr:hypothetical protein [Actinoplanes philippinensis]
MDRDEGDGQQLKEGDGDLTDKIKDDLSGTVRHVVDEVGNTARSGS